VRYQLPAALLSIGDPSIGDEKSGPRSMLMRIKAEAVIV
jgi:hypothetical protein